MTLDGPTYTFVLPKGWDDGAGTVHRDGVMRLATARDELAALRDPAVADADDPMLGLVLLSRVITRLGSGPCPGADQLQSLYAADLTHLLEVHAAINYGTQDDIDRITSDAPQRIAPLPPRPAGASTNDAVPTPPTPVSDAPPPGVAGTDPPTTPPVPPDDEPDDPTPAPAPKAPVPKGRRARIQEVGRSTGRP